MTTAPWQPHHIETLERKLGERKEQRARIVSDLEDHDQQTRKIEQELTDARTHMGREG